jgi:ferredoxin
MTDRRTRLCVDYNRCEGHGQCAFVAPSLLHLEDNGALVVDQTDVTDCIALAEKAVDACPTSALRLE